jgi:hypothetical protein
LGGARDGGELRHFQGTFAEKTPKTGVYLNRVGFNIWLTVFRGETSVSQQTIREVDNE